MRPKCLLTTATAIMIAVATAAVGAEGCKGGPKSQWKSPDQAKQAAVNSGFTNIQKVILEDGCYEVVTVNGDGKIVGIHFDPVTLKLEKVEAPR
jgi:hypothetical protein